MRRAILAGAATAALLLGGVAPATASGDDDGGGDVAPLMAPQRYVDDLFTETSTAAIPYAQVIDYHDDPMTLHLDLFEPDGDVATERAAIVFVHGGSFCCGDRGGEHTRARMAARKGYVAVSIEYRQRPDLNVYDPAELADTIAAMTDAQHDAQAAVRWLRANAATYRIDVDHIAMGGYSAGAVTSLRAALLEETAEPAGPNQPQRSDIAAAASLAGAFGGSAEPGDPPVIMMHGTKDITVPYAAGLAQCDTIVAAGNICEWHEYDAAHGLPWTTVNPLLLDFMYRHVTCGMTFDDLPLPHPFCADIDWLVTNALANGYADGGFHPTATFSRQALVAMLWRMAGAPTGSPDPGFPDVPGDHPFFDAIAWGVDAGFVSGYADGLFHPANGVSRQAAAAWLWGLVGSPTGAPNPGFADVPGDHPFFDAIAWAADAGVTTGYADGGFHPGAGVSRQAGAAQLHRTAPLLPVS